MKPVSATRQCRGRGPTPSHADLVAMLEQIQRELLTRELAPYAVQVDSWSIVRDETFLARVTVEADPGRLLEPMRTWFQWRHAQWQWSTEPSPQVAA